uniref:WAP domain-containing protein n=1 Tax=Plectus sambesii TaxID=2011161 RepID=A0A914X9P0_9BILA
MATTVQSSLLILSVIFMSVKAGLIPGELDWCEYWTSIGQPKPECGAKKNTTSTAAPTLIPPQAHEPKLGEFRDISEAKIIEVGPVHQMTMCQGPDYQQCNTDINCASRTSCLYGSDGRCCLPIAPHIVAPQIFEQCPEIEVLKIKCAVNKPTNWCNSNYDCHNTPVKLCCPTGCGYNMCIQSQGYVIDNGIVEISNPHCPLRQLIEIKCEKQAPTNWCNSDKECQTPNSANKRHCCPTICNYNTCVTNYNGRFIIG